MNFVSVSYAGWQNSGIRMCVTNFSGQITALQTASRTLRYTWFRSFLTLFCTYNFCPLLHFVMFPLDLTLALRRACSSWRLSIQQRYKKIYFTSCLSGFQFQISIFCFCYCHASQASQFYAPHWLSSIFTSMSFLPGQYIAEEDAVHLGQIPAHSYTHIQQYEKKRRENTEARRQLETDRMVSDPFHWIICSCALRQNPTTISLSWFIMARERPLSKSCCCYHQKQLE